MNAIFKFKEYCIGDQVLQIKSVLHFNTIVIECINFFKLITFKMSHK